MDKFTRFLEKTLVPIANKLSQNNYLGAVTNGFSLALPVIMVGALFTLVSSLNIEVYQNLITSIGIKPIISFASTVTTDMLSVYAVFLIAKSFSEKEGNSSASVYAGITALVCFLLMIPLGSVQPEGAVAAITYLPTKFLGSAGLFSAIIIALISAKIYGIFVKKNITIKLPDSVPPTISKSFSAILPGLVIVLVFSIIRWGFSLTSFGDFNTCIYTLIQEPLVGLGASPLTYILLIMICSLMWFFGIHGGMIVMPIINMLYMPALMENLAAFQSGSELPNIITSATWMNFASLGGAGGTLGLCILMTFFAKSERYKALGKLAIVPGICGINEPITFGFPMVLNATMLIPMIITPIITFLISYVCMSVGLVPFTNGVSTALGTPAVFLGFMSVGWQGAILQLLLIGVQILIYAPFFKTIDNQALRTEQEYEEQKELEEQKV